MDEELWKRIDAIGFEPTYEGLKHYIGMVWYGTRKGFEPTYEGLKLGFNHLLNASPGSVSSLPMRD